MEPLACLVDAGSRRRCVAAILQEHHLDLLDLVGDIDAKGRGHDRDVRITQLPNRLRLGHSLVAGDEMHRSADPVETPGMQVVTEEWLADELARRRNSQGGWYRVANREHILAVHLRQHR